MVTEFAEKVQMQIIQFATQITENANQIIQKQRVKSFGLSVQITTAR